MYPSFIFVLTISVTYYGFLLVLYGCLKAPGSSHSDLPSSIQYSIYARQQAIFYAHQIASIIILIQQQYGLERMTILAFQTSGMAAHMLLGNLDHLESQGAFICLLEVLFAAGHRWLLARAVMRSLQSAIERTTSTIPPKVQTIFHEFKKYVWQPTDYHRVSSIWPNYGLAKEATREQIDLSKILKQWASIDIIE
jgi:hypothetical protein